MASAWVLPPTNGGGFSACAELTKRLPLRCTNQLWDVGVRMIVYIEWLFLSWIPFPSFLVYWLQLPRVSAPEEGDNVIVTHDPRQGKCQSVLVATAALRLVSSISPLYSTYILTCLHVRQYYHIIHLRSSVGICAFTDLQNSCCVHSASSCNSSPLVSSFKIGLFALFSPHCIFAFS